MTNPRGGPPIFDVNVGNIGMYAQGSFELIVDDVHAAKPVLDQAAWTQLYGDLREHAIGRKLEAAFSKRRNIVALKKVAKLLLENAEKIEEDLSRASTWHFHNTIPSEGTSGTFVHHPDYQEFARAYASCRGIVAAMNDIRSLTKVL